ncbi:efflux RND transporter periplasmic adaptor subunit, partial [Vibrio parahaemolyticus]|nr:efflux RND transporter periplasmic adaptor subunit [Vibrio parahaemolyticus]
MSGLSFGRRIVERPWLVSLILVLLLVAWLTIGQLKAQDDHPNSSTSTNTTPLAKVMFDTFLAEPT